MPYIAKKTGKATLLASFFLVFLIVPPFLSYAGQFRVVRVYDGDTVKAEGHDIQIRVRLVGIDAPEISHGKRRPGQPYSQRAKKYLADLVLNRTVDIRGYGLGPYSRVLGVIYVDGMNVNLEMVRQGLAEVYRGKTPRGFDTNPYLRAEREAREARRGMWSIGDRYISPREWRRMQRGR